MGSGFKKRKKQMQALQEQLMSAQEEMKNKQVVGTSGGDLVSITLSGEHELLDVKIKKEAIDPDDADGLEDLIKSAYNAAFEQLKESEMALPGADLFGLMSN